MNAETVARTKTGHRIYLLITVIAALLASNVYLIVKSNHEKSHQLAINQQNISLENEVKKIAEDLNFSEKYDEQLSQNIQAEKKIAQKKITELQASLNANNLTQIQLEFAHEEIQRLRSFVSKYQQEIATLKKENLQLSTKNAELGNKVQQASAKISTLNAQNSELSQKIVLGTMLKTNNLEVTAGKIKWPKRKTIVDKASSVAFFDIYFQLGINPLAEKKQYPIYIQIMDPNGNVLGNEGKIITVNDEKLYYSLTSYIDYKADEAQYHFNWKNINRIPAGSYTITVYSERGIMGQQKLALH